MAGGRGYATYRVRTSRAHTHNHSKIPQPRARVETVFLWLRILREKRIRTPAPYTRIPDLATLNLRRVIFTRAKMSDVHGYGLSNGSVERMVVQELCAQVATS